MRPARHILRLLMLAGLCGALAGAARTVLAGPPAGATDAPTSALHAAVADLRAGRYEQAALAAQELASSESDPRPQAWVVVGDARRALGDLPAAAEAYRRFLSACTGEAARLYALEQIARCDGDASPSGPLAAPSAALTDAQRAELSQVAAVEYVESSGGFVVYARNAALAQLVAVQAEQALERVRQTLRLEQPYPHGIEIRIHPTAEILREQVAEADNLLRGAFVLDLSPPGPARRVVHLAQLDAGGQFDPALLDRVLPHELSHLVVAEWFGEGRCPLYLDEGLAMLSEHGDAGERLLLAGAAAATGEAMSLDHLLNREQFRPHEQSLFYAQAFSFVLYLREHVTSQQFASLLERVHAGYPLAEALQRTLCLAPYEGFLADLESAWRADAIAQAQYLNALHELARRR